MPTTRVQVHGGNGYALEYRISRVLCDARILNVFEGAAEIQANIVIKGLLAVGVIEHGCAAFRKDGAPAAARTPASPCPSQRALSCSDRNCE